MAVTTQARPESRATTTKKWVYLFEEVDPFLGCGGA